MVQKPKKRRDRRKKAKKADPPPENMLDCKQRTCLRCGKYFMSTHSGNRRCVRCNETLPRLSKMETRRVNSDVSASFFDA